MKRTDPKPGVLYVGLRGDPELESLFLELNDSLTLAGVRDFKAHELTKLRKTEGPFYAVPGRDFWDRLIRTTLVVQGWRDKLGIPIYVYNGFRPSDYNLAVGGAKYSAHVWAEALDTFVKTKKHKYALLAASEYVDRGEELRMGLGIYDDLEVHVDTGWRQRKWGRAREFIDRVNVS